MLTSKGGWLKKGGITRIHCIYKYNGYRFTSMNSYRYTVFINTMAIGSQAWTVTDTLYL